jgi:hypothetical protein
MHERIYEILKYNKNKEINILDIFKLFYSDYIIFLTAKFFNNKRWYMFKSSLLSYFDKYDVIYFDYNNKNKIIEIINIINTFIKNANNTIKDELIDELFKENRLNNNTYFDVSKKMKQLFFSEHIFEPDILYKKIHFSNQEIFIPFNSYVIKKMEYKLRTFCQIAEKLGAEKIVIDYFSASQNENEVDLSIDAFYTSIGSNIKSKKEEKENIQIVFEYNNHSDINLNKFYIINSILKENEFLITKEEFESDLEIKFLIDARCINFIQKYNTNFIINHVNKIEQKIFLKAQNYGLNIGNFNLKNNCIKINIDIDFIKLNNRLDIIDGTNIHVLREGFIYLSNIIKKDGKYDKIIRFLQSHLNAVEKKWISLNYEYDNINSINKIYNDIIHLNFKEDEMSIIMRDFFGNNLTWFNFKNFRDIILLGSNDNIEKIYFVTFQYHNILNNKKYIMNDINKYIDNVLNYFITNIFKKEQEQEQDIYNIDSGKSELDEKYINYIDIIDDINYNTVEFMSSKINPQLILDFINNNKQTIKNILRDSFKKSFKFNNGLCDNLTDSYKLIDVINNIINYYFDNEIKNLQSIMNNISTSFNVKKMLFNKLIQLICLEIIKNLNLLDTSPNINIIEQIEKTSILNRIQKIFLKFIIKYFNCDKIVPIININFLNNFIPINKVYKNYNKYKLFYTWDDFNEIINYFKNNLPD